jgi:hypothetical protein
MAAYAHRMVQAAGQDGLGEQVRVTQFSCEVIGILAAKGQGGMGDQDDIVLLLPLHTLQRRVTGGRKVSMRAVSMENGNNARRLKASLRQLLRERRRLGDGDAYAFDVRINVLALLFSLFIGAVSAIFRRAGRRKWIRSRRCSTNRLRKRATLARK